MQAANIPLDQLSQQDLLRNNAVIEAKNAVVRGRRELQGRVVDAQAVTRGVREDYMKSFPRQPTKLGAVQFEPWVYEAWVDLVWTDLVGPGGGGR